MHTTSNIQRSRPNNKRKAHGHASNNTNSSNSSGARSGAPQRGGRPPRQKRAPQVSTLDPQQLVRRATLREATPYVSARTFNDMPIDSRLKQLLQNKGFIRPSEIQDRTLETLISGRDLLGIAQTGTGKTGAFLIPIIEQLLKHGRKPYALILVPTRELANQVEEEFRSMTKGLGLFSACFIGGTNIQRDLQTLRRPSHVVIATPGRMLDLVDRRAIDLRQFQTLVLDEFDRMLDMGFVRDVQRIINGMQQREQTMLFSATLDRSQEKIIAEILRDHATIKVSTGTATSENIDQDIIRVAPGEDKFNVLCELLSNNEFDKVLLFEETKHRVKRLCEQLVKAGIPADQIHGNKSQNARQSALNAFKQGRVRVLVATDVAARGIDVSDVSHVINYQMPMSFDTYIHRIGRTGRAGKAGKAFTFVD